MDVDFRDKGLIVYLEEESAFRSRHSGAKLRRIKIGLTAETLLAHRSLLLKIRRAEHDGIRSKDSDGNISGKWKIVSSAFGSRGDEHNPEYYHEITIEELEDLVIDRLCIDDLVLHPYLYDEEFDGDDLSIRMRVMVTPEQDARLRMMMKNEGHFSITRHGINDVPRVMRFSDTILWSRHGNRFKYEVVLVDKGYDERDRPLARLFQPQMSRMQSSVAAQAEMVEVMLETMVTRKYLTEGDVAEMRKKAAERVWDRRREFYEVADIDEFVKHLPRLTWD